MPSVEVVIPFGGTDAGRRSVLAWILDHWRTNHPDWTVTLAEQPEGDWSKGATVNPRLLASAADVIVVADADSWVPPRQLVQAVALATRHGWAMPNTHVRRIAEADTARILGGESVPRPRCERIRVARPGGGIVVARRDIWHQVRGIDPRFVGWGGEDAALGLVLQVLHPREPSVRGPLWHMWHPTEGRTPRPESSALMGRYRAARRSREALLSMVGEWS